MQVVRVIQRGHCTRARAPLCVVLFFSFPFQASSPSTKASVRVLSSFFCVYSMTSDSVVAAADSKSLVVTTLSLSQRLTVRVRGVCVRYARILVA